MQHDFLDRYSRIDSPIHRLRPAVKLVAALALVVGVVLVPPARPLLLGVFGLVVAALALASRVPAGFLARRLLLLEPFVAGVAALALFQPGGWRLFAFLVAKSTVCLLVMVLLANTTPFADLLRVMAAARMPALLVTTLSLMYRYLYVLVDEAVRMRRARASRTFTSRRRPAWSAAATVVGQLFVRSTERAERIHAAMSARGWR